ncbi:hypothetical protein MJH12_16480 [bacterium]|nr:hypothetical protein [bacterium]
MKLQFINYHFQQLKVFLLFTTSSSFFFMNFVIGHTPKQEVIGLILITMLVSIVLGIIQIQKDDKNNLNSDLYLLHLPIEKSHLWLTRSLCGLTSLAIYYLVLSLSSIFNPSTLVIDIMIFLLAASSYFLSRTLAIFLIDKTKTFFISLSLLLVFLLYLKPIQLIHNSGGIGFPIEIQGIYIATLFISTLSISFFIETKHFRKSIT